MAGARRCRLVASGRWIASAIDWDASPSGGEPGPAIYEELSQITA